MSRARVQEALAAPHQDPPIFRATVEHRGGYPGHTTPPTPAPAAVAAPKPAPRARRRAAR